MILRFPEFSREMRRGEEPAVGALLQRAFGGDGEARLVQALRKSGAVAGEVVLPFQGGIVGYYALSRMDAPEGWLCLAPVAIDPDWQGAGHGRRLIGMLAEWARRSGTYVAVLGQVPFYERAGFNATRASRLTTPYPVAQTLIAGPGEDAPQAALSYPAAFGAM
ncbi:GNAT family N-acetyltransferase [Roseovarius sp. M141]|uniref:GNAT family N-acetyltransferase n=1 Tax=Roseovarius sp. M141 TaxID=2583806 RepID=UPI0020CD1122|nr:N-acetyltransferase [Roseovarius sp. M141]MCQ0093917.1 N-acetyltransferase [Roseovarius sp. M141]